MRIDVVGEQGSCVSTVQAHQSFRRCVGQSCAEFALDLLDNPAPDVALTEQRNREGSDRERIINRLTTTHGTIAYTGAMKMKNAHPPTQLDVPVERARQSQLKLSN